jgi:eukaryotic-like serine/threonine-protein kinase
MAQKQQDLTLGGRYRLVYRIATGGMGTVWRAEDTVLDRPVAVKLLSDALGQDARFVERFRREARAAAGLSHPNVAGVYDYGEDDGRPFIVMELLEGETLGARLHREGRLRPEEAGRIGAQVARALQSAHDAGIVHRDVKPANVMLTSGGGVKVMDFGIAAAAWATPLTATGTTIGTASYLSPEQAAGDRATPASDVYALGCVLYETLTGQPPFVRQTPVAVASAQITDRPRPLREVDPGIPPGVAAACEMALAKGPAARPASAAAFAQMVDPTGTHEASGAPSFVPPAAAAGATEVIPSANRTAQLPTPVPVPAAPGVPAAARPGRRRRTRWVWAAVALFLLGAILGVVFAALRGGGATHSGRPHGPKPTTAVTAAGVQVPSVVGLTFTDAMSQVVGAGLVPKLQPVKGPLGQVLGVRPDVGSPLKRGDSVTLYVGNGRGHGQGHGQDNQGHD